MGNKVKKVGTEQFLPKIEEGFIHYMVDHYGETEEHAREILQAFLQVIADASDYGFSVNHSQPYSYIGYIGAYLRYHYPLEFLTASLNIQSGDKEKTTKIVEYARKKKVEIKPIMFGKSRALYSFSKEEQAIYKGIASIKFLNHKVAEELYMVSKMREHDRNDFVGLLQDIFNLTSTDTRQMEILIRLDFFKEFGAKEVLLEIYSVMADKKKANTVLYPEFADKKVIVEKKKRNGDIEKEVKTVKKPLKYDSGLKDATKQQRLENLRAYELAVRANPPAKIELYEQISFEKENLGYAVSTWENLDSRIALVIDVNKKYTPKITLYQVKTGNEIVVKVSKKKFFTYDDDLLYVGDIIKVLQIDERHGWKNVGGKWVEDDSKQELWLEKAQLIRKSSKRF
jgi:DNA polymerase-3 subunit alpha